MKALFAVQAEDVLKGQLEHRRANLPERTVLTAAEVARAETAAEAEGLGLERLEHLQRQNRYEGEVAAVESRLAELNEKLYSGGITSPKEATSLQDEMGHLRRRQDGLEGQVLEVMELVEPIDARLVELVTVADEQDEAVTAASNALGEAEGAIIGELAESAGRRAEAVHTVPDELMVRYERNRPAFGPSTVVGFSGMDCSGCPSSMPAVEADRVRQLPEGTLADCSECGRLVVR